MSSTFHYILEMEMFAQAAVALGKTQDAQVLALMFYCRCLKDRSTALAALQLVKQSTPSCTTLTLVHTQEAISATKLWLCPSTSPLVQTK
jgi:hypothetical protein